VGAKRLRLPGIAYLSDLAVFHLAFISQMQPSRNDDSSRNTTNEYRRLQFRPTAADRVSILAEIESEEAAVVNLDNGLTLPPQNESSVSPRTTYQQVAIQDRNESISSPSGNIGESNKHPYTHNLVLIMRMRSFRTPYQRTTDLGAEENLVT
jgi:hypothetical protein